MYTPFFCPKTLLNHNNEMDGYRIFVKMQLNFCTIWFHEKFCTVLGPTLNLQKYLVKSYGYKNSYTTSKKSFDSRVSVQEVVSLGGHFATLWREFDFYEVKKILLLFSKRKWKYFYTFNHFYSEKSSKRAK